MKPLLVILNPRNIPACVDSLKAIQADQAWFTGYREPELVDLIQVFVERDTVYDAYVLVADDVIVSQRAFDAVVALMEQGHPAVTGYCRLDSTHPLVNITKSPLFVVENTSKVHSYEFYSYEEAQGWPSEIIPTHFMGNAFTGLTRELRLRFPYNITLDGINGVPSDFENSVQLANAGIPMVAARSGYIEHVKTEWNKPDIGEKALLIGKIPAEVRIVIKS